MDYQCKLTPIHQLWISPNGIAEPLCNLCSSRDCTNPIENKTVSVIGVNKTYRLYKVSMTYMAVSECQGFNPTRK